mmetsp:Transcript_3353/g.4860  ORF Transcript_3353/g.4860 Transcript_3353/m.4860 type:complete len:353 (+) Transcript_3353:130-1188(+)
MSAPSSGMPAQAAAAAVLSATGSGDDSSVSEVRKGRFLVTTIDTTNENEPSPPDDFVGAPEGKPTSQLQSACVDVRKQGRFVVVTEFSNEDDDEDFTSDDAASIIDQRRTSMSSLNSLNAFEVSQEKVPPPNIAFEHGQSSPNISINQTPSVGLHSRSNSVRVPGPQGNKPQDSGLPPTNKKKNAGSTPTTIMFELQKISAQNRKLHKMLLELTLKKGLPEQQPPAKQPNIETSEAQSEITPENSGGYELKRRSSGSDRASLLGGGGGGGRVNGSTSSINVPSVDGTSRLQELVNELNSNTINLVTEYDALKMRNFVLTKQLKDVKQQLKESNLLVENLKSELAKEQQKYDK